MTRMHLPRAVLVVALGLAVAGASRAAADDPLLHLRAWAVNLNNGARTNTVDIVIERWQWNSFSKVFEMGPTERYLHAENGWHRPR